MSLESIAQAKSLAAKGRNGDSVMVHMNPGEVAGLQALAKVHGTSLSINPDTGMPEAFSLRRIVPTIVGTAVGVATGNPMLGAAVAGGLGYASTGSLMGGLTSAAGAYGGTGLVSGVNAAGTTANLAAAGSNTAMTAAPGSLQATLGELGVSQAGAGYGGAGGFTAIPGNVTTAGAGTTGNLVAAGKAPISMEQLSSGFSNITDSPEAFGNFLKGQTSNLVMAGGPILSAMAPEPEELPGATPTMIRPFEYIATNTSGGTPYSVGDTRERTQYTGEYRALEPYRASEAYKRKQPFTAADGGIVAFQEGGEAESGDGDSGEETTTGIAGIPISPGAARTVRNISMVQGLAGIPALDVSQLPVVEGGQAPIGLIPRALPSTRQQLYDVYRPDEKDSEDYQDLQREADGSKGGIFGAAKPNPIIGYTRDGQPIYENNPSDGGKGGGGGAAGGVMPNDLRLPNDAKYAKGRFLQGPGDGTSDDIPAIIGNKQPARLADGEFVIDARTVSEIGNGSSKAGAKKLYAMMDRVHGARKKAKRGQDTNADKFMPA